MSSDVKNDKEDDIDQNTFQSSTILCDNTQGEKESLARAVSHRGRNYSFPTKLYFLLQSQEFDDIISWHPSGMAFILHDDQGFVDSVMPKYFKQTQLRSFQRQLNLYQFKSIVFGFDKRGYYHPNFIRGQLELCSHIRRRPMKSKDQDLMSSSSHSSSQSHVCSVFPFMPSHVSGNPNSLLCSEIVSSARIDELFGQSFSEYQSAVRRNLDGRSSFVHHSAGLLSASGVTGGRTNAPPEMIAQGQNLFQRPQYTAQNSHDNMYTSTMGNPLGDTNRTSQSQAQTTLQDLDGDDAIDIQNFVQLLNSSTATPNPRRNLDGRTSFVHHSAGLLSTSNGTELKDRMISTQIDIPNSPNHQYCIQHHDNTGLLSDTNHASMMHGKKQTQVQSNQSDHDTTNTLEVASMQPMQEGEEFVPNNNVESISPFDDSGFLLDLRIADELDGIFD
jgi:hypothetical protein